MTRSIGVILWVCAMVATCYGHAMFFVEAQHNAGNLRARQVVVDPARFKATPTVTSSDLSALASQQAQATQTLAMAKAHPCKRDCREWNAKITVLEARVSELGILVAEKWRSEQIDDAQRALREKQEAAREEMEMDPVTRRLASTLGIKTDAVDLALGIGFGLLLETVACFCWLLVFSRDLPRSSSSNLSHTVSGKAKSVRGKRHVGRVRTGVSVERPVAKSPAMLPLVAGHATHEGDESCVNRVTTTVARYDRSIASATEAEISLLISDIAAGTLRPTVVAIRRHLRCSQAKAMALRRILPLAQNAAAIQSTGNTPLYLVPSLAKTESHRLDRELKSNLVYVGFEAGG